MEKINQHIKKSKEKLGSISFRKIAPNMVTMLALCSGLTSIRYSIQEDWTKAILFIFVAGILDMLDGRVARMLKASTKFGAELDSLSDFACFGVAPAIMVYQWTLYDFPKFGWFFCMLFTIAMSMRLARFNTMLDDQPQPSYWRHFFVGVPAPAAAGLALLPIMFSFEFPEATFLQSNGFMAGLMCLIAFLMVSRIPTISTKKVKIPTSMLMPLTLVVVFIASFMISQPWLTLSLMTLAYAVSIPIGVIYFLKEKKKSQ